jgi:hypothetical protein
MNDTLKIIVETLETGKPELQVAAAQILGELRAREPAVVRALGSAVRRSPVLGRFCLDALSKIATPDALELIARVLVEHEQLADHAAHLLGDAGSPAHEVLVGVYGQAVGEQRNRILAILAKSLSKDAIGVFVQGLLTPETTETASRLLQSAASQFVPPLQKALREGLAKYLQSSLPDVCLAQVVAVLAKVDGEGSRSLFLDFTGPETVPVVRSAALRALQGTRMSAAQVRSMMDLLEDPLQKDVHEAAREALAQLPEVPEALVPVLKRLLSARPPEQRLFALRMLRTSGAPDVTKIALKSLDHGDPRFRQAAADVLAYSKHAVEPMVRLVLVAKDPALARTAADILVRLHNHHPFSPKFTSALADKAVRLLATNSFAGDLLLGVLLATGSNKMGPMLVDRGIRLRRARRLPDALHVLARVAASPLANDECRYQLALAKLLQDMTKPAVEVSAPGNSTMGFFAALVRNEFPLLERLCKESSVTPEAMLRVAMHFSSAVGAERKFGTELLKHLASRKKGRAGDEARVVLRAVSG